MPFKSKAQAAYLAANRPDIFNRWKSEGYSAKGLPKKVKKKK